MDVTDLIESYLKNLYVAKIIDAYGAIGEQNLNRLTKELRDIYTVLDLRKFDSIYVLKNMEDECLIRDASFYKLNELVSWTKSNVLIELKDNGYLVREIEDFDPQNFCDKAIIYEYTNLYESFYLSDGSKDKLNHLEGHDSYFIKPSYKELDEALAQYKRKEARTSSCLIMRAKAWTNDNRVVLVPSPEWILRDSLYQFLKSNLRNYKELLREQNVNVSKPIDIKISWNYSNKVALIEVKWIGMSGSGNAYLKNKAERRVNEGAIQLVEYLNLFRTESPDQNTRGYLVTFDARRDKVSKDTTALSREDGFKFQNEEIDLDPNYPSLRNDFEPHVRIFLEPNCLN
ncbi:hypothetical protein LX97_00654 [Nonlabens dokdonensis]|jgi:hypothetical protein|uniref:Uncharacterized protein n=2 Tax=Nonlabens dokdonensis TaxID=328515 RepID=L7W842_NONDD|nr:hypothetical protein [Nonlabens dokdonensis]AGC75976.1 hypothetical protein DDD_0849 [Nonlabens dokdonensis DSW-6]PZX43653.1 hypothetical protein LX97_00654 [Nonlabens dokdonensis]